MRPFGSAAAGLLALGVISGAFPVQSDYADCMETYRSYLEELSRKQMSPERRAALHRWAKRVYDACETGDLDDPKGLFERLDRNRY
jgi:hypothetical protein